MKCCSGYEIDLSCFVKLSFTFQKKICLSLRFPFTSANALYPCPSSWHKNIGGKESAAWCNGYKLTVDRLGNRSTDMKFFRINLFYLHSAFRESGIRV